jgi:hypothetical protein
LFPHVSGVSALRRCAAVASLMSGCELKSRAGRVPAASMLHAPGWDAPRFPQPFTDGDNPIKTTIIEVLCVQVETIPINVFFMKRIVMKQKHFVTSGLFTKSTYICSSVRLLPL